MRRRGVLWTVLLVAMLAGTAAAWIVGSRIESPGQAAANAAPPEPSVITAEVVYRRLSETVVLDGEVAVEGFTMVEATAPPSVLSAVVISVPAVGDDIGEGVVVASVSGRPIIVLEGLLPAYRDLQLGLRGPDVLQLEQALSRLGLFELDPDDEFGRTTEKAVQALYESAGFDAASPDLGNETWTGWRKPSLALPASEILFIEHLPASIATVEARPGDVVDNGSALATITSQQPVIAATIRGAATDLVIPGLPARVFIDSVGLETEGTVASVGDVVADPAQGIIRPVTVEVSGLDSVRLGSLSRIVIETEATPTEVLAVPVGAVHTGPSGEPSVVLVEGDTQVAVAIEPGRVIGGYIELVDSDPRLVPGALLVVGWR